MNVEDRYRYLIEQDRIELRPGCEPAQKLDSIGERWMAEKTDSEMVRKPLEDVDDGWTTLEVKTADADGGMFKARESQHYGNLWLSEHEEYRERCYGLVVLRREGDDLIVVDDAVVPVHDFHVVSVAFYSWTERGDGERELAVPWRHGPWLRWSGRKRSVR